MAKRGNGEGSVYKRQDGLWAAAVSFPYGRRRTLYAKTRQEAQRKLAAAIRERDAGMVPVPERVTLTGYLKTWLELIEQTVRKTTWVKYEEVVRLHVLPYIGQARLNRLGPADIQLLYSRLLDKGASPQSVKHVHNVLHRAMQQALKWDLVSRNVVTLAQPPKVERQVMQSLTPEQARHFLEVAQTDRLGALYVLALTTGMRQGELLAAKWVDVDLEAGSIGIQRSKTKQGRRHVSLTGLAVDALKAHRVRQLEERLVAGALWHDSGLIFTSTAGTALHASNLRNRSFSALLVRAGLPKVRFHDLRHSTASLLLSLGIHPKIVSEMLGHSRVGITLDTYSHALPGLQRDAVKELERLLAR